MVREGKNGFVSMEARLAKIKTGIEKAEMDARQILTKMRRALLLLIIPDQLHFSLLKPDPLYIVWLFRVATSQTNFTVPLDHPVCSKTG